ncbi:MAG: hypothetical protein ACREFQ_03430 [Stellaceae bacterium]
MRYAPTREIVESHDLADHVMPLLRNILLAPVAVRTLSVLLLEPNGAFQGFASCSLPLGIASGQEIGA